MQLLYLIFFNQFYQKTILKIEQKSKTWYIRRIKGLLVSNGMAQKGHVARNSWVPWGSKIELHRFAVSSLKFTLQLDFRKRAECFENLDRRIYCSARIFLEEELKGNNSFWAGVPQLGLKFHSLKLYFTARFYKGRVLWESR